MKRLDFLTSRTQRAAEQPARTLGQALAEDTTPAWYRIRSRRDVDGIRQYVVEAYTARRTSCPVPDAVALLRRLFDANPGIDFWLDHDVDAVTGAVYAAPEPHEDGYLPGEDGTFGALRPPHLVADRAFADRGWFDTVPPMPARWAA